MSTPSNTTTSQQEATTILAQVLSEFNTTSPQLEPILRQCQHVCQILGWQDNLSWFYRELNGYHADVPPNYRMIRGKLIWQPDAPMGDSIKWSSEASIYGKAPEDIVEEDAVLDVYSNIDWVIKASQAGFTENTSETKTSRLRSGTPIQLRRIRKFNGQDFLACITAVKRITFDFVSQSYAQLKYGNAIQSIWADRRAKIDIMLQPLGFTNHLTEIEKGLNSPNPESWRSAVFECRSLLSDLADHIWRDPRPTYEHLLGKGPDGKLSVTKKEFANRISAYFHQRGLTKSSGRFIRNESERLSTSIRSLIEYQSKAHNPIGRDDAVSIALATYFLVGEILLKTDVQPIEKYVDPHPSMVSDNEDAA
jgi:hypothetical protein